MHLVVNSALTVPSEVTLNTCVIHENRASNISMLQVQIHVRC